MSERVNLIPKRKKRSFPFWSFFVAIGLVNVGIVLFVTITTGDEYSVPLPEAQNRVIGGSIAYDGDSFWATGILITFGAKTERDIVQFDNEGKVLNVFTIMPDERYQYEGSYA